MSNQNTKTLERLLKALANKRRIEIIRLIRTKREMSVGTIAEEIKLSVKATSKHLGILTSVGLVDREQRNVQVFYKIASDIPESARKILSIF